MLPATHVVHEKRDLAGTGRWVKEDRVQPHVKLPNRIGLKQNEAALAGAQRWLMEAAHPASEQYGQHWTQEEVVEAFRPSADAVDQVLEWISETAGIAKHRITHTDNKAWLAFDAKAEQLETLLHATYYEHHDAADGRVMISCDKYHLPSHIRPHIDYITPGVKGIHVHSDELHKRSWKPEHHGGHGEHGGPFGWQPPKHRPAPHMPKYGNELATCDVAITPACIQALYDFEPLSPYAEVSPNNSMGIFEEGDFYAQEVSFSDGEVRPS